MANGPAGSQGCIRSDHPLRGVLHIPEITSVSGLGGHLQEASSTAWTIACASRSA